MSGVEVGSVAVTVVPDASKFGKELAAKLVPQAAKIGTEIGKVISQRVNAQLKDIDFGVHADTAAANAKITELEARLDRLEHKKVTPRVEVNGFVGFQNAVSGVVGEVFNLQNLLITSAPLMATVATVGIGAAGGIATAFTAAGAAAGAFALVALPEIKKQSVGLKKEFTGLQKSLSGVTGPAVKSWVGFLEKGMPLLSRLVRPAASALKGLGDQAKKAIGSPFWKQFFTNLGKLGGTALTAFGKSAGYVAKGLAGLLTAFMPLAREMLPGIVKLSKAFADWATHLAGSSGFQSFIDYVKTNGPKILGIIGNLGVIVGKAIVALLPLGALMTTALSGLTGVLAKLSPNQMLLIATGIAVALAVATGGVSAIVTAVVLAAALIVKNWSTIKAATLAVAHWFAGPLVSWFKSVGSAIAAPFTWLYHKVILPVFHGIQAATKPFIVAFKVVQILVQAALKATGLAARALYNAFIAPAFRGIRTVMHAAWAFVSKYVITPFVNGIRHVLGPVFGWLWHNVVSPAWNGLKTTLRAGWNFISKYVFSPFRTFIHSTLPGAFRAAVKQIGQFWNGLKTLTKAPINFVISTIYDKGIRGVMGTIAKFVGKSNPLPYVKPLATGGHVRGPGSGTSDSIPAMLSNGEFVVRAAQTKKFLPLLQAINAGVPGFAGGGLVSWITHPLANLKNAIGGPVKGLLDKFGHNGFVQMLAAIPGKITSDLVKKITSLLGSIGSGGLGGGAVGNVKSVQAWSGIVSQVLAMLHQPGSALGAVLHRIKQESGGNPRAINMWDSNAKAGHPSQGLMQTIPGTFAAYAGPFRSRGILDPLANIYAGVNYAIHRYGSGWIRKMVAPGGYALGGLVKPQLFDMGGYLPPGLTTVMNATGKPEPVLTGQQWNALRQGGDGSGSLMRDVYITQEQSTSTALDTLEFRLRHMSRGGVYAGN